MNGIYQISNTLDGTRYIGSAINVNKRKNHHFHKLSTGVHANAHLQGAYNCYGAESFTFSVLIYNVKPTDLVRLEQVEIDKCRASHLPLYNIRLIATSNLGIKLGPLSEEHKAKLRTPKSMLHRRHLSEARKGRPSPHKGKTFGPQSMRKPHCLRGHARVPENLYSNRTCRTCAIIKSSLKFASGRAV